GAARAVTGSAAWVYENQFRHVSSTSSSLIASGRGSFARRAVTSRRIAVVKTRTGVSVTETQYTVYGSGSTWTSYESWRNGTRSSMIRATRRPQYASRVSSLSAARLP